MSYFKALSSYWPGRIEKDDHDPFWNIGYVTEANREHYRHINLLTARL
jgi:hypothetical protein